MDLEGECKILNYTLLKLNIPKAIFFTILAMATVIGLLFLVWYKWTRVKLWYSECRIN